MSIEEPIKDPFEEDRENRDLREKNIREEAGKAYSSMAELRRDPKYVDLMEKNAELFGKVERLLNLKSGLPGVKGTFADNHDLHVAVRILLDNGFNSQARELNNYVVAEFGEGVPMTEGEIGLH
jgi:hypothetical protein